MYANYGLPYLITIRIINSNDQFLSQPEPEHPGKWYNREGGTLTSDSQSSEDVI